MLVLDQDGASPGSSQSGAPTHEDPASSLMCSKVVGLWVVLPDWQEFRIRAKLALGAQGQGHNYEISVLVCQDIPSQREAEPIIARIFI